MMNIPCPWQNDGQQTLVASVLLNDMSDAEAACHLGYLLCAEALPLLAFITGSHSPLQDLVLYQSSLSKVCIPSSGPLTSIK